MKVHWFLPTSGDGPEIIEAGQAGGHENTAGRTREPTLDYLAQVAQAADQLGFESVLTPAGTFCRDGWITTAALIRETERLKFLVAFRPGLMSPTLAAQMAATYQEMSAGRLLLNVVTGGDPAEQQRFGDWLGHDDRYARTAEFLTAIRGAWSGTPFDLVGEHYTLAAATVAAPPSPVPPLFFGGASRAAEAVAAAHADVYLAWGEPPPALADRIASVRARAATLGRTLEYGVRLHVIARQTAEDAWAAAESLLDRIDPATIARAQEKFARSESEGQRRMVALHGGSTAALTVYPNLWAGYGLVRGGAGTALVGSFTEVAARIREYAETGVSHVILSGNPHLEEAYRIGEGLLPLLRTPNVEGSNPCLS